MLWSLLHDGVNWLEKQAWFDEENKESTQASTGRSRWRETWTYWRVESENR
jgi:hypothetical protein